LDVLALIDKLDDLIHNARTMPFSDKVAIEREEIYELLDQMRSTIPEEIKQSRWIVKERQEMLAEAKREADRLVADARDKAAQAASQEEIVKRAGVAAGLCHVMVLHSTAALVVNEFDDPNITPG